MENPTHLLESFWRESISSKMDWKLIEESISWDAMMNGSSVITAIFHCYFMCCILRPKLIGTYWYFSLVVSFFGSVGGGTIAHFLLGKSPSWLLSNWLVPSFILIWYLVNFSPFDVVYRIFHFLPFKIFVACMEEMDKTKAVFGSFDLATRTLPEGSIVGPIICGYITGFGGSLIALFSLRGGGRDDLYLSVDDASEFSRPTWSSKGALWSVIMNALVYHQIIPFELRAVRNALVIAMACNAASAEIMKEKVPFFIRFAETIFFKVTGISEQMGRTKRVSAAKKQN